jgi:hypothetical protein
LLANIAKNDLPGDDAKPTKKTRCPSMQSAKALHGGIAS